MSFFFLKVVVTRSLDRKITCARRTRRVSFPVPSEMWKKPRLPLDSRLMTMVIALTSCTLEQQAWLRITISNLSHINLGEPLPLWAQPILVETLHCPKQGACLFRRANMIYKFCWLAKVDYRVFIVKVCEAECKYSFLLCCLRLESFGKAKLFGCKY